MPTQRNLWPYAIIATFVLFASYIGYMVQQALRTDVELVSPNYYQQELAYQQRMESVARTVALPAPVQIRYEAAAQRLTLELPAALAGPGMRGQVHFFRPSDQKLDFTLPFVPTGQPGRQQLSTARLRPGHWWLRLDFKANGQAYFIEQELSI
ncbi:FixH family protein [Hymenobacter nivis]|uniref:Nitrogen fixation protein FixH n=1 Tax=Hymenobacter nivis TaxID=1850093 RepID=A0A502GCL6_9BACT|nr:FixH family protein [Hymenobacter nivis]TPG58443.1 nitrogen fixation protein FixH [Hymenobacter nivis]